jgi:hypothetical protein
MNLKSNLPKKIFNYFYFITLSIFFISLLRIFITTSKNSSFSYDTYNGLKLENLLYIILLVPLFEEFVYRYWFQKDHNLWVLQTYAILVMLYRGLVDLISFFNYRGLDYIFSINFLKNITPDINGNIQFNIFNKYDYFVTPLIILPLFIVVIIIIKKYYKMNYMNNNFYYLIGIISSFLFAITHDDVKNGNKDLTGLFLRVGSLFILATIALYFRATINFIIPLLLHSLWNSTITLSRLIIIKSQNLVFIIGLTMWVVTIYFVCMFYIKQKQNDINKEEATKIVVRQERQNLLSQAKKAKESGESSEDELKRFETDLQKEIETINKDIESLTKQKETDLMKM